MTLAIEVEMKGKVALVTGAASGLGRASAIKLAQAGADLCLVDVNVARLAETAEMIGACSGTVLQHVADLADPRQCQAAVDDTITSFGRLDALCNVAGILYMGSTPDMPPERFAQLVAINFAAPFVLSQCAIPHLLERNGAIVNVASSAAFIGEAYAVAYGATKAAVVNMTKAMAMEYSRKSIRINAVAPGGMVTNISENVEFPPDAEVDLVARYSGLRGQVEVEDAAEMVALLASPAGRSFHGACISIDAGITAG